MRVLFAGGGTAGHINPALAVAGYLRETEPDTEILYVGSKGGMEERLVPAAGFLFRSIVVSGFQRRISFKNLGRNAAAFVRMFSASGAAKRILREFRPDICVGTGGYVAGPVIREAVRLGIPAVIHEQNAYPGVTNRILSRYASRTMLASPDARKYLSPDARCVLTGNPIRREILRAKRDESRKKLKLDRRPVILSFGGSLGARKINEAAAFLLAQSAKSGSFQHIHGCGRGKDRFLELLAKNGVSLSSHPEFDIREYITNMPECLAAADLVICRAGAITLSELQAQGKPAILIPSPNVAENHQYRNAMSMVRRGAAVILEEKDLTGESLCGKIRDLFSNPETLRKIGERARAMAVTDANERIVKVMREVLRESGHGRP